MATMIMEIMRILREYKAGSINENTAVASILQAVVTK